jgi:hypothetical protein
MPVHYPMTKEAYLDLLRRGRVPLRFGYVFHRAEVVRKRFKYRVRELVMDPAVAAKRADVVQWGDGYNKLVGVGRTLFEDWTLCGLISQLEALDPWPRNWD